MNSATKKTTRTKVITAGKNATSAYFEKSGIRHGGKMIQNPFIAFNEGNEVEVELVDDIKDLIKRSSTVKVMARWPGKIRSDYVNFTVGDLKKHINANPPRSSEVV